VPTNPLNLRWGIPFTWAGSILMTTLSFGEYSTSRLLRPFFEDAFRRDLVLLLVPCDFGKSEFSYFPDSADVEAAATDFSF